MNSTLLALNRWAEPALALAWPMLWQSSLLIAFLFALDFAFRRRLRASVRYALWLLVLLKLALPPSLALPTGLGWWLRPPAPAPATPRQVTMVVTYGPARAAPPLAPIAFAQPARPPARLSAMARALAASSAVSLGLLAWMLARWRQVAREARRAAPAPEWLEELFVQARRSERARKGPTRGLCRQLCRDPLSENRPSDKVDDKVDDKGRGRAFISASFLDRLLGRLRRPPRLRLIERPMSPAVCGLFGPVILLPRALAEQLPPDQLRTVLLHELIHLRRGDPWLSLVQTLFQILYWWHPLLWLANARIRRAREEAVDDAVMLALEGNAEAYAPTLLQVARLALSHPPVSLGLVGILESRSFLRQRIERLLDFRPPRKAGLTLASVFSVAAFAALALPMGQAPAPAQKLEPAAIELASALTAAPSTPATVPEEDRFKSRALVQVGKVLYEMGKLDKAEAKFKQAGLLDSWNKAVDYYLNLVREARTNKPPTPPEEHSSSKSKAAQFVQDGKLLYEMGELDEAEAKLREARRLDPLADTDRMTFLRRLEADGTTLERYRQRVQAAVDYYLGLIQEARTNKPASPSEKRVSSKAKAARLVQDGKLLYEMGKLDEAEAKLKEAREEDPENQAPYYYLNLLNEARFHAAGSERDALPAPDPYARTNLIYTGRGRQIIARKLDRIRLDEVRAVDSLPLSEVVRNLDDLARKHDPDGRGINFIIAPSTRAGAPTDTANPDPAAAPLTPSLHISKFHPADTANPEPAPAPPIAAQKAEAVDPNTVGIRISHDLHDVRLADFLEIIVKGADKPIKYSIEDYGVVFWPKGQEQTPRYLRTIKVDRGTLENGMRKFLGLPWGGAGAENPGTVLRQFPAAAGVDLSPPNSMFYGDREGTLLVYASLADLDIIERAVAALHTAPPQLNIKAVFIGLPKREVEAFWEKFGPTNGPPSPGSAKTVTLTHAQAAAQLDRLRSMDGVDMLGQLQVTTLSGRQAQLSVEDAWTTSTKDANDPATPEKVLSVPTLAIVPHLTPDGAGVQLDLVANLAEFIGYDEPGPFPVGQGGILGSNGAPATAVSALPHFRVRQLATSVGVQDGQTLVLVGGFHARGVTVTHHLGGDIPVLGRPFRDEISRGDNMDVLVFVTPVIIDPAGNRIHVMPQ